MVQDSQQTPVMVLGADPAANTEISDTVPDNELWEVLAVIFSFVADANVANRIINASFQDADGNEIYKAVNRANITATQDMKFEVIPVGVLPADLTLTQYGVLPQKMWLGPGCKIKTVTTNIQATDNYGKTKYWVRKWTPGT